MNVTLIFSLRKYTSHWWWYEGEFIEIAKPSKYNWAWATTDWSPTVTIVFADTNNTTWFQLVTLGRTLDIGLRQTYKWHLKSQLISSVICIKDWWNTTQWNLVTVESEREKRSWLMIACTTWNSNLVPLPGNACGSIIRLYISNLCRFEFSGFLGF